MDSPLKGSEWNKWDLHIHTPMTWQASGALEYGDHGAQNSMRKAICDVLEGSRHAFEAREQKYGMLWLNMI